METAFFQENLIYLDLDVNSSDDYFRYISNELYNQGYVKDTFYEAVASREKKYPTGLPSNLYKVAIPHSDCEHIVKPFISVTRLKKTVPFIQMGSDDVILEVKFIFLLGFYAHDNHQIEVLQVLIDNFMNDEYLNGLDQHKTCKECFDYLQKYI